MRIEATIGEALSVQVISDEPVFYYNPINPNQSLYEGDYNVSEVKDEYILCALKKYDTADEWLAEVVNLKPTNNGYVMVGWLSSDNTYAIVKWIEQEPDAIEQAKINLQTNQEPVSAHLLFQSVASVYQFDIGDKQTQSAVTFVPLMHKDDKQYFYVIFNDMVGSEPRLSVDVMDKESILRHFEGITGLNIFS